MRLQQIISRIGVVLGACSLVASFAGNVHAASPCKENCKPVFKACKNDMKDEVAAAKDFYKQKKQECKQAFEDKEDRKTCRAAAKDHKTTVKAVKKPTMKDCKDRFKDVQLPECKLAGLTDACSPMGGFPSVSGSLF
jgi:hypothetical protein